MALWLQRRRRARQRNQAPAQPIAVFTTASASWDVTEVGFADVALAWTFAFAEFPPGILELWCKVGAGEYSWFDTVDTSAGTYAHISAASAAGSVFYKLRYHSGTGGIIGPFSQEVEVVVSAPPARPAAPVIVSGEAEWNETEEGWADGLIDWTFAHGSYPVATFELFVMHDATDDGFSLLTTVPSNSEGYRDGKATQLDEFLFYKMRYCNGTVIGPFSNVFEIHASPPS